MVRTWRERPPLPRTELAIKSASPRKRSTQLRQAPAADRVERPGTLARYLDYAPGPKAAAGHRA